MMYNGLMFYYKAVLQYDGTGHCGFQWQPGIPTVQNELNFVTQEIMQSKVSTMGASRTDSGVHAYQQVLKITTEEFISPLHLEKELKAKLPSFLRCLSVSSTHWDFRPAGAELKEYRYFFTNKELLASQDLRFLHYFSHPLDLEKINYCLSLLPGLHDFSAFSSQGSNVKSTVRKIEVAELSVVNPHRVFQGSDLFLFPLAVEECFQFKFVGNGFLKQMVRHLVGALWLVGSGKMSCEDFSLLLQGPRELSKKRWKAAPARGLFLYSLHYPDS